MRRCKYIIGVLSFVLMILKPICLLAQSKVIDYPVVGKKCPDFTIGNVNNFTAKSISLADFKGKWLVLDFWNKICSACISGFPKMNKLQQEFKDKMSFVLVGNTEKKYNTGIEKLYREVSKLQQLDLINGYDSLLFKQFGVTTTPHVVIIDPNGIVRAVTFSNELSRERLLLLLAGKDPGMVVKENIADSKVTDEKRVDPFVGIANADNLQGFAASLMSKWSKYNSIAIHRKIKEGNGYRSACMSVAKLYNVAYLGETDWRFGDSLYGKYWKYPVVETGDSIMLIGSTIKEEGLYNYALVLPKDTASVASIKKAMQYDLKKYFGYEVYEEEREMPCWFIVTDEKSATRLKTKGKLYAYTTNMAGFKMLNSPVSNVLHGIWNGNPSFDPIFDKTNINFNIDLTLVADMTDMNSIIYELSRKGLDLIKGSCVMKVLVISK